MKAAVPWILFALAIGVAIYFATKPASVDRSAIHAAEVTRDSALKVLYLQRDCTAASVAREVVISERLSSQLANFDNLKKQHEKNRAAVRELTPDSAFAQFLRRTKPRRRQ